MMFELLCVLSEARAARRGEAPRDALRP
jgi:hypothetical protein